jgi:hypothetical protein
LRGDLADLEPAVVHIDSLYNYSPATVDQNRLTQVGAMLTEVQHLCAEHDATLWFTAHMNQSGAGFDLKRITGAGVSEWADSWHLLRHRQNPDVEHGRFWLTADIGSRQWGGASYELDLDIGRFDPDTGTHDGPIRWTVHTAGAGAEPTDRDRDKRLTARTCIVQTMKRARNPLSRDEIKERTTGVSKTHIVAETALMIEDGILVHDGSRSAPKNGRDTPLFVLDQEWASA